MVGRKPPRLILALSAFAPMLGASHAWAALICGPGFDPNTHMLSIQALTGTDYGYYGVTRGDGTCSADGTTWTWQFDDSTNPINLVGSGGQTIASYSRFGATMIGDPSVSVVYGVSAGPAPTNFLISSTLPIAPLFNPAAIATANNTLTDTNGNGGSLVGSFPLGNSFRASYNG